MGRALLGAIAAAVVAPLIGVPPAGAATTTTTAVVNRWVDGDTVNTSKGTIRLIGVDTPESGRCGYAKATELARRIAPVGSTVILANPSTVQDKDGYGRHLRYVLRRSDRVDVAYRQIRAGSRARYDAHDGYQWHERQRLYRQTDAAYANYSCTTSTGGSYAPVGEYSCPSHARIKGNRGSNGWIYHQPWQQYYDVTKPEECFATAAAAEAAGYRAAKV